MANNAILEDELEHILTGMKLTHLVSLVSEQRLSATITMLKAVDQTDGRVEAITSRLRGDGLEHQLRISNMKSSDVRRLCDRIGQIENINSVRVEHQFHREAAPKL